MRNKAICSFFVLFAIVAGIGATTPAAFAEVTIVPVAGSQAPGCEKTTDGCFVPSTVTVDVGGKVIFSNTDTAAHTFTAGTPTDGLSEEFDTSLLMAGSSYDLWSPDTVGEFPYFCMIHPWMQGLIIVVETLTDAETLAAAEAEALAAEAEALATAEAEALATAEAEALAAAEAEALAAAEAEAQAEDEEVMMEETEVTDENGGGCLIATATFGSEMAPQVQQLRELRDNTILSTESGTAFITGFNQFYYSFSPTIADLEREQPIFKEVVKLTLTPMLSSLSLLNYVDIDSEQEMIGYGISLILLNIGMYVGIPAFGILKLYQFRKN